MVSAANNRYKLSRNLALIESNGLLVLFSGCKPTPLCITKGADQVKNMIDALRGKGSFEVDALKPEEAQLVELLRTHALVVAPNDPELFLTQPEDEVYRGKAGMRLSLLVTTACNKHCSYCRFSAVRHCAGRTMSRTTMQKAVNGAASAIGRSGVLAIEFTGGEPLLCWGFVEQTVQYCASGPSPLSHVRRQFSISTNLCLVPSDFVETCRKYGLSVSANAPEGLVESSEWKEFAGELQKLGEAKVQTTLKITATKGNQGNVVRTVEAGLKACPAVSIAISPAMPVPWMCGEKVIPGAQELLEAVREIYDRHLVAPESLHPASDVLTRINEAQGSCWACGMPLGNTLSVDPQGDIYPCSHLVGLVEARMGNVLGANGWPLPPSVLDEYVETFHVDSSASQESSLKCASCQWRYLCGGPCPAIGLLNGGCDKGRGEANELAARNWCALRRFFGERLMTDIAQEKIAEGLGAKRRMSE